MAKTKFGKIVRLLNFIKITIQRVGNNITIISFLTLAILSCIFVYSAFKQSNKELKASQQLIIQSHINQFSKFDKSFENLYIGVLRNSNLNDSTFKKIMVDSMFAKTANLSTEEQDKINKYVKSIVIATNANYAYKDLVHELKRDSTLVKMQINQAQQDTKTLLTLEFNKIQQEYQELQLWAAVLTIVFLIFSFYSLFKTDDLMKQGRDGLKDIQKIKNDSQIIVEKTKTEQKTISDQLEVLKTQISEIETSKTQNEEKTKAFGKEIEEKKQAFQDSLKLNSEVTSLRQQIAQLSIDVNSLRNLYDSIGDKEEKSVSSDDSQIEESVHDEVELDENFEDTNDVQEPKQ